MAQRRRSKKWIFKLIFLVLLVAAGVIVYLVKESYFTDKHKNPVLYPEISALIAQNVKHSYAMMDSSDGLIDCLYKISTLSNVKLNIDYSKIPHKTNNKDFVLYGGEDYSLVICINEDDFKKIPNLVKIGTVEEGFGVYVDNKKIGYKSYEHF